MVAPEEYFYYLKRSLIKHGVFGCKVNKKVNNRLCIYMEDGKWVISNIKRGIAVDPKVYDIGYLWRACEEIIRRACKNEEKRKKVWMDWASPTNWAEKMDVELVPIPLTEEQYRRLKAAKELRSLQTDADNRGKAE